MTREGTASSSATSSACDRLSACPRCGVEFSCGAARPASSPCACAGVTLSAAHRAALAERWQTCLCPDCLRAIAGGAPP